MVIVKLQPEKPFTLQEIKKLSKQVEGAVKVTSEIKKGKQYILVHINEQSKNN